MEMMHWSRLGWEKRPDNERRGEKRPDNERRGEKRPDKERKGEKRRTRRGEGRREHLEQRNHTVCPLENVPVGNVLTPEWLPRVGSI